MKRYQSFPPAVAAGPTWRGFRNRRILNLTGSTAIVLPEHAPIDPRTGKVLVCGWVIGAGGGASAGLGGGAGGFSEKTWLVTPLSTATFTIGTGGPSATGSFAGTAGGQSTLVLDGVTLTGLGGGGGSTPGGGPGAGAGASGGDINATGANGTGSGVSGTWQGGLTNLLARAAMLSDLKDLLDASLLVLNAPGKGGTAADAGNEYGGNGFGLLLF
jgi:hypothetical protein